jgi:hypothetical protein
MKRTWACSKVEVIHSILSVEEYDQILDEWAEVVYRYLCQLHENQAEAPETLTKRTGTDGY